MMNHNDWEHYFDLGDRHSQLDVLEGWVRDVSQTYGNSEEALLLWLSQMSNSDALPRWWGEADLEYMRRRLLES